tara:strand:- start:1320 stop:1949 length:630 start_codon:yes stop_codon:yes gene_type:complete
MFFFETNQNLLQIFSGKRKLVEEGRKHEMAKTAAEKAAVRKEIEVKRNEQQNEMQAKSKKEANEKSQIAELKTAEKQQVEKDRTDRENMKKEQEQQRKRDAADKMKQIEEPGFEYFDVIFRGDGSLDLWFKPGMQCFFSIFVFSTISFFSSDLLDLFADIFTLLQLNRLFLFNCTVTKIHLISSHYYTTIVTYQAYTYQPWNKNVQEQI